MKSQTADRLVSRSAFILGSACETALSGTHMSGLSNVVPWNPGGATPTMANGVPLIMTVRPTTDGSEVNRLAKSSALITATGVAPVASSSSRKTRPCLGMTPRTAK